MGSGIQVKEPDLELMSAAIPAPPEKFIDKDAKSISERVTYLEKVVGRSIDLTEIKYIYFEQMKKIFNVRLLPGELTQQERDYYQQMEKEYTNEDYFMERSERRFAGTFQEMERKAIQFKVHSGPFIRIIAQVKDNRLEDLIISGSIHASPLRPTSPIHEIEKALAGEWIDKERFTSKIEKVMEQKGFQISGVSPAFLAQKIQECALS